MSGETDLSTLLAAMNPALQDGVYVFATMPPHAAMPAGLEPLMTFREAEGTTLVLLAAEAARSNFAAEFPSRLITLNVHSSLAAVGFLAAILPHLAAAGMGVNPVSGYFHDHLFVPADRAEEAVAILQHLSAHHRAGLDGGG